MTRVSEVEAESAEVYDKLNKIPEASREQLADAETVLGGLEAAAEALGEKSQQTQAKQDRETKRKEDFEKLRVSEKRREELLTQQLEIEALQSELENANRAQRLLPEKQTFDTAVSELEKADESTSVWQQLTKTEADAASGRPTKSIYDAKKRDAFQEASD